MWIAVSAQRDMSRASPEGTATFRLWLWEMCCLHWEFRTGVISQHLLDTKWKAFEGRWAEAIFLNMPSVFQITPESCSQVQLSSLCLLLEKGFCALFLLLRSFRWHPTGGKGSALGSGWSMVQTTDFSFQSETTVWSSRSVHCAQFLQKSQACKAGGASWYGLDLENPLLRGH